jgi:hypothetical protein
MVIVPEAEPKGSSNARVSARDEQKFFDESRAAHELEMSRAQRAFELEKSRVEASQELARRDQEMGALGRFFGGAWSPQMYISASIALMLGVAWFVTLACPQPDMADARKYLLGAIMSVISYLFGAAGARPSRR